MDEDRLSLTNVMNGGLVELFDRELQEVLRNITDRNTPAKKSRKIGLEVVFKPFADRSGAGLELNCSSNLCGAAPAKTEIFLAVDKTGKVKAWSRDPRQVELFHSDSEPSIM
jgi:hypothetical protein